MREIFRSSYYVGYMDFTKAPLNHGKPLHSSHGTILGKPIFGQYNPLYFQKQAEYTSRNSFSNTNPKIAIPGEGLKRALHYYADYGGCGLWRMCWPEFMLNGYGKAVVNGLTQMIVDPNFYRGISAIKLQRQATPEQLKFVQFLKMIQQEHGFKIIYEVDDVVFSEDIPLYNRSREAFDKQEIKDSVQAIIALTDEMCVVSPYMRDYYKRKTGKKEISVIPNYAPRFWLHDHYHPNKIERNYVKNRRRPMIGYIGSGTHLDVANVVNQQDDFGHVIDSIIATRHKYQWVFMGAVPLKLIPFVERKEIISAPWANIYDYPRVYSNLNINAVVAPLARNEFNRAKSDIKIFEAGALGIPGTFQRMEPYASAKYQFSTGEEMISNIDIIMKDRTQYMKLSRAARENAEKRWLEDHLDEHTELLFKSFNEKREALDNNGYNVI